MEAARLHLIDGTYELFRAHYSPSARTTARPRAGMPRRRWAWCRRCWRCCTTRKRRSRTWRSRSTTRSARSATICSTVQERRGRPARAARAVRLRRGGRARAGRRRLVDARARGRRRAGHRRAPLSPTQVGAGAHHDARQGPGPVPARRARRAGRSPAAEGDRRGGVPRGARLRAGQRARFPGADRRHGRRHPGTAGLRREDGRPCCWARTRTSRTSPTHAAAWTVDRAARRAAGRDAGGTARRGAPLPDAGHAGRRRPACARRWTICASGACRATRSRPGARALEPTRCGRRHAAGPTTRPSPMSTTTGGTP